MNVVTVGKKRRLRAEDYVWHPTRAAEPGSQVYLRFRDNFGTYSIMKPHFLHDDGFWYRVNPPTKIKAKPIAFAYVLKGDGA